MRHLRTRIGSSRLLLERLDARSAVRSVRRRSYPRAMTLGIVVFGAAFLVGLGLGTYTRRPLSTAFLVLGSFTALLVLSATGEVAARGRRARDRRARSGSSPRACARRSRSSSAVLTPIERERGRERRASGPAGVDGTRGCRGCLATRCGRRLGASSLATTGPKPAASASSATPALARRIGGAQKRSRRKSPMSWRVAPSIARSARISPTTEQNL